MQNEIEFLKPQIDAYNVARDAFLKAALRSGFIVEKDAKKREASAREAFLTAKAKIYSAAEREFGAFPACDIVNHLEQHGIIA